MQTRIDQLQCLHGGQPQSGSAKWCTGIWVKKKRPSIDTVLFGATFLNPTGSRTLNYIRQVDHSKHLWQSGVAIIKTIMEHLIYLGTSTLGKLGSVFHLHCKRMSWPWKQGKVSRLGQHCRLPSHGQASWPLQFSTIRRAHTEVQPILAFGVCSWSNKHRHSLK